MNIGELNNVRQIRTPAPLAWSCVKSHLGIMLITRYASLRAVIIMISPTYSRFISRHHMILRTSPPITSTRIPLRAFNSARIRDPEVKKSGFGVGARAFAVVAPTQNESRHCSKFRSNSSSGDSDGSPRHNGISSIPWEKLALLPSTPGRYAAESYRRVRKIRIRIPHRITNPFPPSRSKTTQPAYRTPPPRPYSDSTA